MCNNENLLFILWTLIQLISDSSWRMRIATPYGSPLRHSHSPGVIKHEQGKTWIKNGDDKFGASALFRKLWDEQVDATARSGPASGSMSPAPRSQSSASPDSYQSPVPKPKNPEARSRSPVRQPQFPQCQPASGPQHAPPPGAGVAVRPELPEARPDPRKDQAIAMEEVEVREHEVLPRIVPHRASQ